MKNIAKFFGSALIAASAFLMILASALSAQDAVLSLTEEVHDAGQVAYETACASCHLTLMGGSFEAPELAGPNFYCSKT